MPVSILKDSTCTLSGDVSPGGTAVSDTTLVGDGTTSTRNATPKTVCIAPVSELISPLMLGKNKSVEDFSLEAARRVRRPSSRRNSSCRLQTKAQSVASPRVKPVSSSVSLDIKDINVAEEALRQVDCLVDQVTRWMEEERLKRYDISVAGRAEPTTTHTYSRQLSNITNDTTNYATESGASNGIPDFDKLAEILKGGKTFLRSQGRRTSVVPIRRKLSIKSLQKKPTSSDTEGIDNDLLVPSTDVVLDNSKTMTYTGGGASDSEDSDDESNQAPCSRDLEAWAKFKFEILRLINTLRLKGWRKVPLEMSGHITVQRLSGALTNAVYVVGPPKASILNELQDKDGSQNQFKKAPPKLLLRVYGPQVEHLIDREAELAILRRLARKRIGPRMLGTFANGRFEEFFHAQPLTPTELRDPQTSRQIAKRMRELHEGIDLLDQERQDGPFVWRNWDKWVQRVEQVVCWLDQQILALPPGAKPCGQEAWKKRGFICGVPWKQFREIVVKYRSWLEAHYGGLDKIKAQLIFSHNDTQYGNILRLIPSRESPLLMPANSHKQLVVIDFEYSNANLPGLEFANHFTEWCYNYHDERKPYACTTSNYPDPEAQDRFVRAYVRHRPQFNAPSPQITPQASPQISRASSTETVANLTRRPTSSITDFMLDARTPPVQTPGAANVTCDEEVAKASEDADVERLISEARLWRVANSAQWVAWGIVQAKVPGMPDFDAMNESDNAAWPPQAVTDDVTGNELYHEVKGVDKQITEEERQEEENEEEEFDYLGYAQHRAMFFWGDVIQLGFIKREELPAEIQEKIKIVPY